MLHKCDKLDKTRGFHKSELLGACTYIAALEKGIVFLKKRKYKNTYRYRKREVHTIERIADKLNTIFASIRVNGVMYRSVRPDRLIRCAEQLAKNFSLPIYSKIQIDPATDTIYKNQIESVESAIADIIVEKLQLKSPAIKPKPFDRVWRAFITIANKIDKRNLLKTNNLLTNRGHLRAPNVIAAALIYKVCRNQVTIRQLRKAAGCGDKSLQRVLRIIMCSTKYI